MKMCLTRKFGSGFVQRSFAAGMLSFGLITLAQAASTEAVYPTRPVRFIVPFAPSGGADIAARILADKLSRRLGQQFIIDNRGGANGVIGMEMTARAPADGYTLVISVMGPWAVNPHLYKLSFDVQEDLAPVMHVMDQHGLLSVHPSLPVKTVKDVIALARAKPETLTYGSGGIGGNSHLAGELFALMANVRLIHVPYKGTGLALAEVGAGHINLFFGGTIPTMPHIKSGRVRAIAATSGRRLTLFPELPTVAESGLPGYEAASWTGIGAPGRTPPPVISKLNRALVEALELPDVKEQIAAMGGDIVASTPEQFRAYLSLEIAKYGKLVKAANIQAQRD